MSCAEAYYPEKAQQLPPFLTPYLNAEQLQMVLLSHQDMLSAPALADILNNSIYWWDPQQQNYISVPKKGKREDHLRTLEAQINPLQYMREAWRKIYYEDPCYQSKTLPDNVLNIMLLVCSQSGVSSKIKLLLSTGSFTEQFDTSAGEAETQNDSSRFFIKFLPAENKLVITYSIAIKGIEYKNKLFQNIKTTGFAEPIVLFSQFTFTLNQNFTLLECKITEIGFEKLTSIAQQELITILKKCQVNLKVNLLIREKFEQHRRTLFVKVLGHVNWQYQNLYGATHFISAKAFNPTGWQSYFEENQTTREMAEYYSYLPLILAPDKDNNNDYIVEIDLKMPDGKPIPLPTFNQKLLKIPITHQTLLTKLIDDDIAFLRFLQFFSIFNKHTSFEYFYNGNNAFTTLQRTYVISTKKNEINATYSFLFDSYINQFSGHGNKLTQWIKIEVDLNLILAPATNIISVEFIELRIYGLPTDLIKLQFLTNYFAQRNYHAGIIAKTATNLGFRYGLL
jgi:hypothetical protein